MCRYIQRPVIAKDRLTELADGRFYYGFKRTWKNGTKADEVLSETSETAETQVERGLVHFNRYMNALKANRLDEALEHYITAIEAVRTLALFPPHKFKSRTLPGDGSADEYGTGSL